MLTAGGLSRRVGGGGGVEPSISMTSMVRSSSGLHERPVDVVIDVVVVGFGGGSGSVTMCAVCVRLQTAR